MFSNGSLSSISLATVTPSWVTVGAPNFLSIATLRPRGPSVVLTASATVSTPRLSARRASSLKQDLLCHILENPPLITVGSRQVGSHRSVSLLYLTALVEKDADRLSTLVCGEWEDDALIQLDSFRQSPRGSRVSPANKQEQTERRRLCFATARSLRVTTTKIRSLISPCARTRSCKKAGIGWYAEYAKKSMGNACHARKHLGVRAFSHRDRIDYFYN